MMVLSWYGFLWVTDFLFNFVVISCVLCYVSCWYVPLPFHLLFPSCVPGLPPSLIAPLFLSHISLVGTALFPVLLVFLPAFPALQLVPYFVFLFLFVFWICPCLFLCCVFMDLP